jgi:drug/metabolite transporter (DMT)-like permease
MHELPTAKGTFAVAYLVGFGSIVAFSAYIWLLHHVRTALAGSYAYVNPVIAVMLGAWLAAERFTVSDLGAMAVILSGVVAITLGKAKKKKPESEPQASSAEKTAEEAA